VNIGAVVIGRNEGARLKCCLNSIQHSAALTIYVDSGSTDGSVAMARAAGADVIELNLSLPFTAARARNAGFKRLREMRADIDYVQFVDGDCELKAGWMQKAAGWLETHADAAVVCGRLRERYPERTIYNLLCDIEWDAPAGETRACGGVAMFRAAALTAAGGYRADLIAGEEPELCLRLRVAGWKVWRLADAMALHDAAMIRFSQWWRRSVRSGYAYAEGAFIHGDTAERYCVREARRAWLWAAVVPVGMCAAIAAWGHWGLLLLAVYPLQIMRLSLRGKRRFRDNFLRSTFLVLGKFAEVAGQIKFHAGRLQGRQAQLIEYK